MASVDLLDQYEIVDKDPQAIPPKKLPTSNLPKTPAPSNVTPVPAKIPETASPDPKHVVQNPGVLDSKGPVDLKKSGSKTLDPKSPVAGKSPDPQAAEYEYSYIYAFQKIETPDPQSKFVGKGPDASVLPTIPSDEQFFQNERLLYERPERNLGNQDIQQPGNQGSPPNIYEGNNQAQLYYQEMHRQGTLEAQKRAMEKAMQQQYHEYQQQLQQQQQQLQQQQQQQQQQLYPSTMGGPYQPLSSGNYQEGPDGYSSPYYAYQYASPSTTAESQANVATPDSEPKHIMLSVFGVVGVWFLVIIILVITMLFTSDWMDWSTWMLTGKNNNINQCYAGLIFKKESP